MEIQARSYDFPVISSLAGMEGVVHSIYRRTIALDVGGKLISITGSTCGTGPGCVIISLEDDFEDNKKSYIYVDNKENNKTVIEECPDKRNLPLSPGERVLIDNERILLGRSITILVAGSGRFDSGANTLHYTTGSTEDFVAAAMRNLPILQSFLCNERKNDLCSRTYALAFGESSNLETDFIRMRWADLFNAVKKSNEAQFNAALGKLVGLGWGLTPSCDDMLIGMLGISRYLAENIAPEESMDTRLPATGKTAKFLNPARFIARNLARFLPNHLHRTGFISSGFLSYALEGRFTGAVKKALNTMFAPDITDDLNNFKELLNYGASSGYDTLTGICLFLTALSERLEK